MKSSGGVTHGTNGKTWPSVCDDADADVVVLRRATGVVTTSETMEVLAGELLLTHCSGSRLLAK